MALSSQEVEAKFAALRRGNLPQKPTRHIQPPRQRVEKDLDLPQAPEIEKALLGGILQHPDSGFPIFARAARKGFFANPINQELHDLARAFWEENGRLELRGFTTHLTDVGRLPALGGASYVTELFVENAPAEALGYYIDQLRERYVRRQAIVRSFALASKAKNQDVAELLADMAQSVEDLKQAAGGPNGAEKFEFQSLMSFDSKHDPNCLVGNRYIVRGSSTLWAGGSGYGKSSLEIQLAIFWAVGRPCFGLRPVRALKSLIVQAENDRGDMSEQTQGVIAGLAKAGEIDVEQSKELIAKNLCVYRVQGKSGQDFLCLLDSLLELERPDLAWIDPLFAFGGCDLMNAERTGNFLRDNLFPMASKRRVALNVLHHVGKPVRGDSKATEAIPEIDYQYLGFGTSEIQNSFRAINILVPIKSHDIFKLVLSKRGERAGACDADGNWSRSIYLKHSTDGICWLQTDKPPEKQKATSLKYTGDKILEHMSIVNGWLAKELQIHMKDETGMSGRTFYRLWDLLKKDGKIRVDGESKWCLKN